MSLTLTPSGEREIVITRSFDGPRSAVFAALTNPALVSRWLLGPPGWTMPVCEIDLKIGGTYRYVWRSAEGQEMGIRGSFLEIAAPARLVHTEKFDQAWYPGEAQMTSELSEQNGKTLYKATLRYELRDARDAVLKVPMEKGLAVSYERLNDLLKTKQAA